MRVIICTSLLDLAPDFSGVFFLPGQYKLTSRTEMSAS